jgi:hypothetical protein
VTEKRAGRVRLEHRRYVLKSPVAEADGAEGRMDFRLIVSFVVLGLMVLSGVADALETLAIRRAWRVAWG